MMAILPARKRSPPTIVIIIDEAFEGDFRAIANSLNFLFTTDNC
jgi:hypothetical protein